MAVPLAIPTPVPPWPPAAPPANMLLQEWKYEMRREAQEVLPGLYLGPFQASTSLARLKNTGITHILCLRDRLEERLIYPRFPTEFRYFTQDVSDSGVSRMLGQESGCGLVEGDGELHFRLVSLRHQELVVHAVGCVQNIISLFPRTREFIDEALACGGAVLVHCNSGIATSPAIVMGYLMDKFGWDYQTALMYVQSKRYCVSPNSFEIQLREYGAIVDAHKALTGPKVTNEHKRPWDGDGDAPGRKRRQGSVVDMDTD